MNIISNFERVLSTYLESDVLENAQYFNAIGTVIPDTVNGDVIVSLPKAGYLDAVKAGCKPTWVAGAAPTEKNWKLALAGIYVEWCADIFNKEITRMGNIYNLSADRAIAKFIKDYMTTAVANSALAVAFLGDTTSTLTGAIKETDGIVKQSMTGVKHVDLEAKNVAGGLSTKGDAIGYMRKLVESASGALRQASDGVIIVTQALWDALADDTMVNFGINIDGQWTSLYNGLKETKWGGYNVVVIPGLDEAITATGDKGVLAGKPFYGLFTTKSNLEFGVAGNAQAGIADVNVGEDSRTQTTLASAKFAIGAAIVDNNMAVVLY